MRAVLDVNVLISAILSPRGAPAQLLRRWLAGEFELIVSETLLAEFRRAVAYPKVRVHIPPADAEFFIESLRRSATLVEDTPAPTPGSTDPGDDYLLALARQASAVLVSGDRHLLDLGEKLPIRSPRTFLDSLP